MIAYDEEQTKNGKIADENGKCETTFAFMPTIILPIQTNAIAVFEEQDAIPIKHRSIHIHSPNTHTHTTIK